MKYEPFIALAIGLAVGLLIGLQREQSFNRENREEGSYFGGIRTYPLFALAGGVSMLLAQRVWPWIFPAVMVVLAAPVMIAYAHDVHAGRDRGLTSILAFLLTFLLGALCASSGVIEPVWRKYQVVAAVGVGITALLSLKEPLHQFAARISKQDIYDTIRFLLLAVIILPLLPNQAYGPLDAINPFIIGTMIVLIAAVGFAGYVLIRVLGPGRGMALTGLVGGLVSSTVVTLSSSARARKQPQFSSVCALAIVLASTVMIVRVLILVGAIEIRLLPWLAVPMAAVIVAGLIAAFFLWKNQPPGEPGEQLEFSNPFALGLALEFGLLYALVLLATKAASVYLPTGGLYVAAALAGLANMDAISISMAQLAGEGQITFAHAALAILLATVFNTLAKAGLAVWLGGWVLGRKVAWPFLLMLIFGGAAAAAMFMRWS